MPLLKNGELVDDPWQLIGKDEALPSDTPVIVDFDRWRQDREQLLGRNAPVGVKVGNAQKIEELAPDLDRIGVIVLEFPKFIDGRAYTQARLLRERFGYRNELRATGNVLRDELMFMHRCGFDAFEIQDAHAVETWKAAMAEFNVFYQPAADGESVVSQLRRRIGGRR
jgi:uncharacterized protein (DUF934 family)